MIRKFYGFAWFFLVGSVLASVIAGSLNEFVIVAYGLVALGLVYALALWSVLGNTGYEQPD